MRFAYAGLLLVTLFIGGRFLREFAIAISDTRPSATGITTDGYGSQFLNEGAARVVGTQPDTVVPPAAAYEPTRALDSNATAEPTLQPIPARVASGPLRHPGPVDPSLVLPGNFEYLGAIRPPHVEDSSSKFSWGGAVIAYRPDGDPQGEDDGFPGSLFLSGHVYEQEIAELSIPRPVLSPQQSLDDLSVSGILQSFGDTTNGTMESMTQDDSQPFQLGGLQVTGNALHWTIFRYYNVEGYDFLSHGLSSLSLQRPYAAGPWHLGPFESGAPEWHAYKHAGYICDVPPSAALQLGNRNLISGLQISTGLQTSSQGPALFAYRLPEGSPPVGASLDAIPLVWYPLEQPLAGHHPADYWTGAAWLNLGGRQAVMVTGRKATGPVYYGEGRPQDCSDNKGYHGPPYEAQAVFYDTDDLLAVAHGKGNAFDVQPAFRWTSQSPGGGLIQYMFPTCEQELGGLAYDRQRNLLYLVQLQAGTTSDSPYEPLPIIHVFRVVG